MRLDRVVNGVAMEYRLPLVANKEESIVLKGDSGRKKKRGVVVGKVELLGVILDDCVDFNEHWQHRIGNARSLPEALGGVRISRCSVNPVS